MFFDAESETFAFLDACYSFDAPTDVWLEAVASASLPALDRGLGVFAHTLDVSDPATVRVDGFFAARCPPEISQATVAFGLQQLTPAYRAALMNQSTGVTATELGGELATNLDAYGERRISDFVAMSAVDPDGHGWGLCVNLPERMRLAPELRERWRRIAAHMGSSYRLRRRLAATNSRVAILDDADAVMTPNGALEHARDAKLAGSTTARSRLRNATLAYDRARHHATKPRKSADADESPLASWTALTDGQWSLVDTFDSDGKRYIVARENRPSMPSVDVLTAREKQVAAFAALGHSNKMIAYTLGISASTVGVLMWRAANKVGAQSRDEMVATFQRLFLAPKT